MIIAFDTETYPIAPGNLTPKPVVFSFSRDGISCLREPNEAAACIGGELDSGDTTLVGHNVPYDCGVLAKHYPELMAPIFEAFNDGRIKDTKVRQWLIDNAVGKLERRYSLADLEVKHLNRDRTEQKNDPDGWRLRYAELDGVPLNDWPRRASEYALADAEGTLGVFQAQEPLMRGLGAETEITRSTWALHLMSAHGMRTDPAAVERLKARLLEAKEKDFDTLASAGLYRLAGSQKALREGRGKWAKDLNAVRARVQAAYVGRNIPDTTTGKVSYARDTLEHSGDPMLEKLGRMSVVEKLLTAFVPVLERGTKAALMPSFGFAETGRTTCSAGRDGPDGLPLGFNQQQLPRGTKDPEDPRNFVRECFVPEEGKVFVACDYSSAELCGLGDTCLELLGRSKLAEELNAGLDPLLAFGADLLHLSYEEAQANKTRPDVANARQFAKVGLYGKGGGMGVNTMLEYARTTYGVIMSPAEARRVDAAYFKKYPEMRAYFALISRMVGEGTATVTLPCNGLVRGDVSYTAACNTYFQGIVAAGAREAVFQVSWECYVDKGTPLFGCRPCAFIHDEIIIEVPRDTAHEAALRLAEVMRAAMPKYIKRVKITAEPCLMERWYKGAKPVYENGRLVPWQPK